MDDPRALLQRYGLQPRRSLGQNFLIDPTAPRRIADGADLSPADTVLEIGAGVGTLTWELLERARRVIAVETDAQLVSVLRDVLTERPNLTLVHGDILTLDPAALLGVTPEPALPLWGPRLDDYRVVANLPYYITAAVLKHVLEAAVRPKTVVVTVQREVAERMVAQPGDDMGLLSVSVQFYGQARLLLRLKRGAFFPAPAVESAVVRLDLYAAPPVEVPSVEAFFRVARAGFAQRRKQLRNTLAATLALPPALVAETLAGVGIDPARRAETLCLPEWGSVTRALFPLL